MKNKNHGQTLVEVLIALGAATLIVSAIVVVVLSSLGNAQFTKNQNLATQFAQEGIEVVKSKAQSNWSSFSSYAGSYCLDQGSTILAQRNLAIQGCQGVGVGPTPQNAYPFAREVDITQSSISCSSNALVTVLVSWSDVKCTDPSTQYCHQVKLTSCISNNSGTGAP